MGTAPARAAACRNGTGTAGRGGDEGVVDLAGAREVGWVGWPDGRAPLGARLVVAVFVGRTQPAGAGPASPLPKRGMEGFWGVVGHHVM